MSNIYSKMKKLNDTNIGSCNALYIKPKATIKIHCHKKLVEIEYVFKGNCKTYK